MARYVDGKPFDVVVNVSRTDDGNRFVYEVTVKKNKGLPPLASQTIVYDRQTKVPNGTTLSGNPYGSTVPQGKKSVKTRDNA